MSSNPGREHVREGETCWRRAHAARAAVLVDGSSYYGALRSSLLKARRSIFMVGWDIDSRCPVRGSASPQDDAPELLGPLLTYLAKRNRDLSIYVLLWDYSVLYAAEREPLPRLNLDWRTPARVSVCLDDKLPIGASHHEKLVVIDDAVAFCGGLDLTIRRWDTSEHLPGNPDRKDPAGDVYPPFHDVQMVVDGDVANSLGELVRARWSTAQGTQAADTGADGDPWPEGVTPRFADITIGIARTRAEYGDRQAYRQVEAAYLHAIRTAERIIYIENQYLTVPAVADALRQRLHDRTELELIIVTPRTPSGWLEAQTMGVGRQRFLQRLTAEDMAARIRVRYPWVTDTSEKTPVMVHAKLMIVDDQRLHIGSSNLACRSMGVDTECDLLVEANSKAHREAICRLRQELLAEHLGVQVDDLRNAERKQGSVIAALDDVAAERRGLAPLENLDLPEDRWTDAVLDLADPERPIAAENYVGDLFGAKRIRPVLRRVSRLAMLTCAVILVLAGWHYSPLAEWTDPQRLGPLLQELRDSAWIGPAVLGTFLLGSLIAFPVTALIAATAIALGPWSGFVWAFGGCLLGASTTYAMGRLLGRRRLEALFGRWLGKVSQRLRHQGIVSVMLIRNVPIAPFSVVNFVAGSTIQFRDFLVGTALGMGPGVAAVTLLGDRLRGVWENPTPANVGLLGLAGGIWLGVALGLQIFSNHLSERRG